MVVKTAKTAEFPKSEGTHRVSGSVGLCAPTKPILLQCDALNYGLGAVLSHIMEGDTERPVGFIPRTLNAAESNYSQLDEEGAAFKNFHNQIYGRCFVIMTDHKPLVSLFDELKQVPVTASYNGWGSLWVRVQDPLHDWQTS